MRVALQHLPLSKSEEVRYISPDVFFLPFIVISTTPAVFGKSAKLRLRDTHQREGCPESS